MVYLIKRIYIGTIIMCLCFGCSSGKIILNKPIEKSSVISSIKLIETNSTVTVPLDVIDHFNNKLKKNLYQDKIFREGTDMIIEYRFIQIKQPGIWDYESSGWIGERGKSLTVEVKYLNSDEKELSIIFVECKGSKFKNAAERAASLIAIFTKQNFGK